MIWVIDQKPFHTLDRFPYVVGLSQYDPEELGSEACRTVAVGLWQ